MKTPKDLKPGDKCYLISRDWKCVILTVKEVDGRDGHAHYIKFEEPVNWAFCAPDVKEFVRIDFGSTLFFDKERVLTYLNQKIAKMQKYVAKIEKM